MIPQRHDVLPNYATLNEPCFEDKIMAQLVKCFECGVNISSEARSCPNCDSQRPHGEECAVCLRRASYKDMFVDQFHTFSGAGFQQRCLHKDCQQAVLKTSLHCPTCRQPVSSWSLAKPWTCSHCGQFITGGGMCHYCNQPVNTNRCSVK